jgi:hypothetical protein
MDRISHGLRIQVTIAALLAALGLCGCSPQTLADLHNHPNSVLAFEVPADAQTTYSRIVIRARERYRILPGARRQGGISTDLEPSGQAAHIILWDSGGIGIRYVLAAEIRQLEPARTQVEIYCATRPVRKEAELWEAWAATPLED